MDEAKQGDTCTVDRILAIILEDPARLDRARERSLLDPRKDPNLRPVHQWKLTRDRDASMPCKQFGDEVNEELNRLAQDDADRTHSIPCHTYNHHLVAEENVKKKWKVEGIWNDKWTPLGPDPWLWKHEESLSSGSPATDQQRREREASRPFHRFMYQVSQERQRIQEPFMRFVRLRAKHSRPVEGAPPIDETNIPETWASLDINARAYQRVKDAWVERGIWYDKWGVLPGMTWKHEHSLEDMLLEELGPSPPAEDVGLSEPVPAASSVPNNGTHERAGGERPFEEWHTLIALQGPVYCVLIALAFSVTAFWVPTTFAHTADSV
ncbi:hypothetical protein N0V84_012527 [Fusarium piperis]|uniref:Uncharacterized protein n=1 Tax=Fusarium piperis TaxID=1435070 RepID=A0A9W8TA47_9HYPO|nr:hypothetical protein N0V84_012527 [Fusarium piperis]